jgi:hypothetical protein
LGGHVPLPVVADQGHQLRVQRDVAVVVQLADRDVQPVSSADLHDRVVLESDQLADPQAGPDQDFADQEPRLVLGGAQELGRGWVIERLGQRLVLAGKVTEQDRDVPGSVVPAPLLKAQEEHPQGAVRVRPHIPSWVRPDVLSSRRVVFLSSRGG